MRAYLAFTKKEFLAALRTGKLWIMLSIFALLGLLNPLIAKFTPELLKKFANTGLVIQLPKPTALDSWTQYYKNMQQIGLVVLVILFIGLLANELNNGTLINLLTKGLKRSTVILAKLSAATILWTAGNVVAFLITYGYTRYYWSMPYGNHLVLGAILVWLFGLFLLITIILANILFISIPGSLLFVGGVVILLLLLTIFPKATLYNPLYLVEKNMQLLTNQLKPTDFLKSIGSTLIISCIFLISSLLLFNKKAL